MKQRMIGVFAAGLTMIYSAAVWAGSSNGGGPAGDAGGSGSEPALMALILVSLIPGFDFARKAMRARTAPVDDR